MFRNVAAVLVLLIVLAILVGCSTTTDYVTVVDPVINYCKGGTID